ncbi:hypothetical protein [Jeotgalibacillus marinus]|uniref:Uncharacterized protein n=1 Tax=Jeotgalibacillus marinus TaxID=86667 RepID=A0ABV3PZ55_9BACL
MKKKGTKQTTPSEGSLEALQAEVEYLIKHFKKVYDNSNQTLL